LSKITDAQIVETLCLSGISNSIMQLGEEFLAAFGTILTLVIAGSVVPAIPTPTGTGNQNSKGVPDGI
jgi:hypothetical protein